jgi:hypothetical protein
LGRTDAQEFVSLAHESASLEQYDFSAGVRTLPFLNAPIYVISHHPDINDVNVFKRS